MRFLALALFAALSMSACRTVDAFEVHAGGRRLHSEWESQDADLDEQSTFGFQSINTLKAEDGELSNWALTIGSWTGWSDRAEDGNRSRTSELSVGTRYYFAGEDAALRPFAGGGLSIITGRIGDNLSGGLGSFGDSDRGLGGYASVGVLHPINPGLSVGMEVRGVLGPELDLLNEDLDTSFVQATFFLGFQL